MAKRWVTTSKIEQTGDGQAICAAEIIAMAAAVRNIISLHSSRHTSAAICDAILINRFQIPWVDSPLACVPTAAGQRR